jgi:hypothetical protein
MRKQKIFILAAIAAFCVPFVAGCASSGKKNISLDDMKKLSQNHALVVAYDDGTVKTYDDNGIKPLFQHLETGSFKNSYVFDKVTGRASSLILAYGGAAYLYTGVLSAEAVPVLEKYNIKYSADKVVDYIINRAGDGKCPMEQSVAAIEDPEEAYKVLKEKFGK